MRARRYIATVFIIAGVANSAHATFYPFYSRASHQAAAVEVSTASSTRPVVAPSPPVYAPAYSAPVPQAAVAVPAPAVISPPPIAPIQQTITPVPQVAYTTPAPTYVPTTPTYVPVAPAYTSRSTTTNAYAAAQDPYGRASAAAQAPAEREQSRSKATNYSVGVEIFNDHYEEPDAFPSLHTETFYGAITGSASHDFYQGILGIVDLRASIGDADYASSSGDVDGITDYEFDSRLMTGYRVDCGSGCSATPYIGIGSRVYLDYFKQNDTPGTYDRRIYQIYLPVGITYSFLSDGWTLSPTLEIDPLLYGYVQSRLQTIPGYRQASNTQDSGSGLGYRAEFLMGRNFSDGTGFQVGPFIRYWDIDDSNIDATGGQISSPGGLEPKNTRLQLGLKAKYVF